MMSTRTARRASIDLPRAAASLRALVRNPDDLPQVFNLIESLSTEGQMRRMQKRFAQSATGRVLLERKPDIVALLADRERLRALPDGSLGRAYLDFVESEGISAEGIRAASEVERNSRADALDEADEADALFIDARLRDTHDLWHAATGYRGDVLGEVGLLAFICAQQFNPAIALIVLAAVIKGAARTSIVSLVKDGFDRGRRARWLGALDWESLLARPLSDVRRELALGDAPQYTPVRTAQLREAGIV